MKINKLLHSISENTVWGSMAYLEYLNEDQHAQQKLARVIMDRSDPLQYFDDSFSRLLSQMQRKCIGDNIFSWA